MNNYNNDYGTYLAQRTGEVQKYIGSASPVIIWSCQDGIYLIAVNRNNNKKRRIYTILDRIAFVTRGAPVSGAILAKQAASTAHQLAHQRSRGAVPISYVENEVAHLLSNSLRLLQHAPIASEAVIVQVDGSLEEDHLTYIDYHGNAESFEQVLVMGTVDPSPGAAQQRDDQFRALQKQVRSHYRPDISLREIQEVVMSLPILQEHTAILDHFGEGRIEVVLLARLPIEKRDFYGVIRRFPIT